MPNPTGFFIEAEPHFLGLILKRSEICGTHSIPGVLATSNAEGLRELLAEFRDP